MFDACVDHQIWPLVDPEQKRNAQNGTAAKPPSFCKVVL